MIARSEIDQRVGALLDEFQTRGPSHELTIRAFRLALDVPHLVEILCGVGSFFTNLPLVARWQADEAAVAWLRECYGYALPILLAACSQEATPADTPQLVSP